MIKRIITVLILMFVLSGLYAQVPNEITYNGKIKSYRQEVNGQKEIKFRIYPTETDGTAAWESETKTVQVSSGVFSIVLSPTVDWRNKDYYIEMEVENKKLSPRQKLTAMPYALHSATSESGSVEENGEFSVTVGNDKKLIVNKDGVKEAKGTQEYYMVPKGGIIIWSGSANDIPEGWALCNGQNGTPNLSGRFVLGYGTVTDDATPPNTQTYNVNATGGEILHKLTVDEMPSHSHEISRTFGGGGGGSGGGDINTSGSGRTPFSILPAGGNQPHENMPPYYTLCYIMRVD